MYKDPIVEEIHKVREEHAKKYNYSIEKVVEDLKKKQKKYKTVSNPQKKKPGSISSK